MAIHLVFFPGESHGQSSLADYSPHDHKESDTTEVTELEQGMDFLTLIPVETISYISIWLIFLVYF